MRYLLRQWCRCPRRFLRRSRIHKGTMQPAQSGCRVAEFAMINPVRTTRTLSSFGLTRPWKIALLRVVDRRMKVLERGKPPSRSRLWCRLQEPSVTSGLPGWSSRVCSCCSSSCRWHAVGTFAAIIGRSRNRSGKRNRSGGKAIESIDRGRTLPSFALRPRPYDPFPTARCSRSSAA